MSALHRILSAVADDVIAVKEDLVRLDAVAGDGDLGVTMSVAAQAVQAVLPELEGLDLASQLKRIGSELARKAPSTCGTLVATGFLRAGRAAGEAHADGVALFADLVDAAQQAIRERGKAAPGDKTLLDALVPAAEALRSAADEDLALADALVRAAQAAVAGAEATRTMPAKFGRAGWLAERSAGHEDAGAHLIGVIFASAARHSASLNA